MIVFQKPFNSAAAKADITGIVEVWLPEFLSLRIRRLKAKTPRLTLSWIVRFALFRMLRDDGFQHKQDFLRLKVTARKKIDRASPGSWRHKLCFYGNDEAVLRDLSAKLRVRGDSMLGASIEDGDIAVLRQVADWRLEIRNRDIVAADVDGQVTLKRFFRDGDNILLHPENIHYQDILLRGDETSKVIGLCVGLLREYAVKPLPDKDTPSREGKKD